MLSNWPAFAVCKKTSLLPSKLRSGLYSTRQATHGNTSALSLNYKKRRKSAKNVAYLEGKDKRHLPHLKNSNCRHTSHFTLHIHIKKKERLQARRLWMTSRLQFHFRSNGRTKRRRCENLTTLLSGYACRRVRSSPRPVGRSCRHGWRTVGG